MNWVPPGTWIAGRLQRAIAIRCAGTDLSMDWLCLPRVDSDACFAKLLGNDQHGYWTIRPAAHIHSIQRRYRQDTLVLETEMACNVGRVRLIDFMPPGAETHDIVRIVEGLEGEVPMHVDLSPRFAHGSLYPWIKLDGRHATLTSGPDALVFNSPVELAPDWDGARLEADLRVRPGDRLPFTLSLFPSHTQPPDWNVDAEEELARTERHWRAWASRCRYQGPYRDAVIRSLLTLKALTYAPTGGIVAAPTALVKVPRRLGEVGVLLEPLTVASKAAVELEGILRRFPWEPIGLRALVLGAGPIGLLGAMMLVARNVETWVYSLEPTTSEPARIAQSFGARYISAGDTALAELVKRIGVVDIVAEAVGSASVAFAALETLAPNGVFIFTGVPGGKRTVEIDLDSVMRNIVLKNQVLLGTVNARAQRSRLRCTSSSSSWGCFPTRCAA